MRIVFSWDWENSLDVITRFDEGIGHVLRSFAKDGHEVTIVTWGGPGEGVDQGVRFKLVPPADRDDLYKAILDANPDVVMAWGSMDHRTGPDIRKLRPNMPIVYFLAGGGASHKYARSYDTFFVETNFHVEDLNSMGLPAHRALGVLTDVLTPNPHQPKIWDVMMPASFTVNKRYNLFADILEESGGWSGCAVGPLNYEGCLIECQKVGISTFGYMSRKCLRDFYCASRVTVLTGGMWGGHQRTVLESLACGTPVVVCEDNPQLDWILSAGAPVVSAPPQPKLMIEAIQKVKGNPPDPNTLRQFVLDNFTADHYYQVVKKEVEAIVNARAGQSSHQPS